MKYILEKNGKLIIFIKPICKPICIDKILKISLFWKPAPSMRIKNIGKGDFRDDFLEVIRL